MTRLCELLLRHGAADAGEIPFSACRIIRNQPERRLGFWPVTAVVGVLPYYTPACDEPGEISAYALAKDYHLFVRRMEEELRPEAREAFPGARFALRADTSPIDEVQAAAAAGLGVIGRNGLLITPSYSSFVFIVELFTDLPTQAEPLPLRSCENCGACAAVCPGPLSGRGECLSAVTQKKGDLTPEEQAAMRAHGTLWGCDLCQRVCPHTRASRAAGTIYSSLEWFRTDVRSSITEEEIDSPEFAERAYAWRGPAVLRRNLGVLHTKNEASPDKIMKGEKQK